MYPPEDSHPLRGVIPGERIERQPEFTTEQITETIAAAIKAHDLDAVPGLIALLAVQDPHAAEVVHGSLLTVMEAHGEMM